jgi:hypothetical protein
MNPDRPNFLISRDGRTHVGIPHLRVFHAHRSIAGSLDVHWRVNQTDPVANARRGWSCPEGGGMWYPGAALAESTPRTHLTTAMHDWGVQLFNDGYVSTLGLRLIYNPPEGSQVGEIDPANPGTLVMRNGGSAAYNYWDPYTLNWLTYDDNYDIENSVRPDF